MHKMCGGIFINLWLEIFCVSCTFSKNFIFSYFLVFVQFLIFLFFYSHLPSHYHSCPFLTNCSNLIKTTDLFNCNYSIKSIRNLLYNISPISSFFRSKLFPAIRSMIIFHDSLWLLIRYLCMSNSSNVFFFTWI